MISARGSDAGRSDDGEGTMHILFTSKRRVSREFLCRFCKLLYAMPVGDLRQKNALKKRSHWPTHKKRVPHDLSPRIYSNASNEEGLLTL